MSKMDWVAGNVRRNPLEPCPRLCNKSALKTSKTDFTFMKEGKDGDSSIGTEISLCGNGYAEEVDLILSSIRPD